MKPSTFLRSLFALSIATGASLANADRMWLLPAATTFSGKDAGVTVDAAISDTLFAPDHAAMRLDGLQITAPDGTSLKPDNASTGRFRSSFDVKLDRPGTYRIAVVSDGVFASWRSGGEMKRARGSLESVAKDIPADAADLRVTQNVSRNETFVTSGKITQAAFAPSGHGIELVPLTHPNDLYAGGTARFKFLIDGQPAAALPVSVVAGNARFRDKLDEQGYVTDAAGEVAIKFGAPGMYWMGAAPAREPTPDRPNGAGGNNGPTGSAGTLDRPVRRLSYSATLEVQPQ